MAMPAEVAKIFGDSLALASFHLFLMGFFLSSELGLLPSSLILSFLPYYFIDFFGLSSVFSKIFNFLVDELCLHKESIKFLTLVFVH